MFKLVVLCVFLAAAAAKPDVVISGPLGAYSTYISPASTTITKQASSVFHPSPLIYNSPYGFTHFIKKRSPQFPLGYYAPSTTYYSTNPLVASAAYSGPLVHTAAILPAASPLAYSTAHLIKKRSAALLPASYIAPTTYIAPSTYAATAPLYSTAYSAGSPFITSPLLSQPISYASHFIKKRSAPLLTYAAPAVVSHQASFDLGHSPLIYSSPVVNPVVYPGFYKSPIYSHVI